MTRITRILRGSKADYQWIKSVLISSIRVIRVPLSFLRPAEIIAANEEVERIVVQKTQRKPKNGRNESVCLHQLSVF